MNERRYEFGDANGAESWVCAKIPHDGAIKKDCVPKVIVIQVDWLVINIVNQFTQRSPKMVQSMLCVVL